MNIPPDLRTAAETGRLVAFVGAGVSVAPPTCLPSWWEVNREVVRALAEQIEPVVGRERSSGLAELVADRQSADKFPPEYQAEVIARRVRHRYFEVLSCLDGDEPNASHLALAALARAGRVRAIVTTNFDRVLEAAFRRVGDPLEVRYRPEQFDALAADPSLLQRAGAPCQLLKIHGSAEAPDTLVDTLAQRKRGLPPATSACIRHLLSLGHWLFVGFSGADLEADNGYLHLRGELNRARGFTWLVRAGEEPLGAVRAIVALYGERAAVVHGELPEWLDTLARDLAGDEIPAAVVLETQQIAAREAAASQSVRAHTDDWASGLGIRRAAVVLSALLDAVGAPADALALLTAMHEHTSGEDRETGTFGLICDALGSLHRSRAENEDALERFHEAIAVFEALDAGEQAIGVRSNLGLTLVDVGRYDDALTHFEAARAHAAARSDADNEAVALHNIALVHRMRGDFSGALALFEEELNQVVRLGDERGRASVLIAIGDALARLDRYDEALERLVVAAAILERLGDEHGRAHALGNTASVHHARGSYAEAIGTYEEAGATFEQFADIGNAVLTTLNLASVAQAQGRLDEALAAAEGAVDRARDAGLGPLRARALHTAGSIQRDLGRLDLAADRLREALSLRTAAGDRQGRADTLNELGIVWRAMGEPGRARDALEEALSIRTELGETRARTEVLNNLAMLAQDRGDLESAELLLRESIATLDGLGLMDRAAPTAFNLGGTCLAMLDLVQALHWFERALAACERIGNSARATEARVAIAWTLGLQGRVGESLEAFTTAEAGAVSLEERLAVTGRMRALADVFRSKGHDEAALAFATRAADRAGPAPG